MSSHWPFRVRPLNNPNLTYCYNVEATPARIASEPTMDDEPASWRQKSLLTFDGGGIRGYTSLLLLEELMIHIGRTEHTYNVVHATSYGPCEKPKGLNHRDTGLQQEKFENCRRGGVYQPVRPGSPGTLATKWSLTAVTALVPRPRTYQAIRPLSSYPRHCSPVQEESRRPPSCLGCPIPALKT